MSRFLTVPKFLASLTQFALAGDDQVFQSSIDGQIRSWIGRSLSVVGRSNTWCASTFGSPVGDQVVSFNEIKTTGIVVSVDVLDETYRFRNTWTLTLDNGDLVTVTWSCVSRQCGMTLCRNGQQYSDRMKVKLV